MHVKRRKNILKKVKGFRGGRKNLIKLAKTAATKAGEHALGDRRKKKANIALDRKILAQLAAKEPSLFKKLVESLKK